MSAEPNATQTALVTRPFLILGATAARLLRGRRRRAAGRRAVRDRSARDRCAGAGIAYRRIRGRGTGPAPGRRLGRGPIRPPPAAAGRGAAVRSAALAVHLVVDSLLLFIVARALLGIAEAFFFVAVFAAGADLAPEERRGEAMNFAVAVAVRRAGDRAVPSARSSCGRAGSTAVWLVSLRLTGVAAGLSLTVVPETSPTVPASATDRRTPPRSPLIHPAGHLARAS